MPYANMGSKKKIAKIKYFLPILDAIAKILLIINSTHPTQKFGFRESLGFVGELSLNARPEDQV